MSAHTQEKVQSNALALLPLLVFLIIFLGSGIYHSIIGTEFAFYQIKAPIAAIPAIILALLLYKQKLNTAIEEFLQGASHPNLILMFMVFMLAGAFASVSGAIGSVDATVQLGLSLISAQFVLPMLFIIAAFIATAMGTSMGTIAACAPIAFGFSQATDITPLYAIGAVVGGAMFGDNLSMISDTTIAATRSQNVELRDKFKVNVWIALPAAIITLIVQDTLHPPQMIQFGYTPHTALFHFEKFYGCPIQVQSGQYAIRFSNQILKAKSIAADQQLNQVLSTQAQQSLNHVTSFEIQQQQLRQKIQSFIEQGLLQQEEVLSSYVAKHLHCSERTLQRQLKAYHLNFQDILDQYRLEQSKLYLQQGKSFSEIAERLNYADQSAFGRAFKRWTGVTPKQFLKTL